MRQGVIAAASTPPGKGGVAIIRMCGEGALELACRIFLPRSGRSLSDYPARTQVYGYVMDKEERVDDGLATYFPSGSSYTGEETVELSIHGGTLITRTVLEVIFTAGAIPAEPGEFTRRAFINGRISLTEAEAIGTLLEAKTREQIRLSGSEARERLNAKIAAIRASLTELLSSIYARIDYPEEDLGDFTDAESRERLAEIGGELGTLISTYRTGRAINEGISAVLCGKPNAGKSTLYNLLAGYDAAIVTDVPGTTRDLLVSEIPLGRVLLSLTDTAGVRSTDEADCVEGIGIERAKKKILESELVLALFDLSSELEAADEELLELIRHAPGVKICIFTKSDKPHRLHEREQLCEGFDATLEISSLTDPDRAIKELGKIVEKLFTDDKISTSSDAVVASARQHAALCAALGFIDSAIGAYDIGISADAAASDIELALGAISEVDGRAVSDEVVADIFSRFCVGK